MVKITVTDLTYPGLDEFYKLFCTIVRDDIDIYSTRQKRDLLNNQYSKETMMKYIVSTDVKIQVANYGNRIIGFLFADSTFAGVGFITWLGVKESLRNSGIARQLIKSYIKFAKEKGSHLVEVTTSTPLISFYKNLGFDIIGKREHGYYNIENIIMDKSI